MTLAKIGPWRTVKVAADQVGRQQVRSELDALEARRDAVGKRPHGERLGQAGDALEQDVSVAEQADEDPLQHVMLSDDDASRLLDQFVDEAALFAHALGEGSNVEVQNDPPVTTGGGL